MRGDGLCFSGWSLVWIRGDGKRDSGKGETDRVRRGTGWRKCDSRKRLEEVRLEGEIRASQASPLEGLGGERLQLLGMCGCAVYCRPGVGCTVDRRYVCVLYSLRDSETFSEA